METSGPYHYRMANFHTFSIFCYLWPHIVVGNDNYKVGEGTVEWNSVDFSGTWLLVSEIRWDKFSIKRHYHRTVSVMECGAILMAAGCVQCSCCSALRLPHLLNILQMVVNPLEIVLGASGVNIPSSVDCRSENLIPIEHVWGWLEEGYIAPSTKYAGNPRQSSCSLE